MRKKAWWKGLLCLLFVLGAGVFYFYGSSGEDKGVLKQEGGMTEDAADNSSTDKISGMPQDAVKQQAETAEEKETSPTLLYIHVCGSVKKPGVYQLFENARVVEAIEAAGGLLPDAAGDYLNQAELLRDGQKVYVPDKAEAEEWKKSGAGQAQNAGDKTAQSDDAEAAQSSPLVNINTATVAQLMELDGIGKSKAEAIIAYREKHGGFGTCEDLMKVPGIKEAAYQKVCQRITVGN